MFGNEAQVFQVAKGIHDNNYGENSSQCDVFKIEAQVFQVT